MSDPHRIIFLCLANSARSQMAEGLARASAPTGWEVCSAGSDPGELHPLATEVMREIGIDISTHQSKGLDSVPLESADVIVTLCAEEVCPVTPPDVERVCWPIPDPARPGQDGKTHLQAFRTTMLDLQGRIGALWGQVTSLSGRGR